MLSKVVLVAPHEKLQALQDAAVAAGFQASDVRTVDCNKHDGSDIHESVPKDISRDMSELIATGEAFKFMLLIEVPAASKETVDATEAPAVEARTP